MLTSARRISRAHEATVVQITTSVASILPAHLRGCPRWRAMPSSTGTRPRFPCYFGCAINAWELQREKETLSLLWLGEHTAKTHCAVPPHPTSTLLCSDLHQSKGSGMQRELPKRQGKDQTRLSAPPLAWTATKHRASNVRLTYLLVAQECSSKLS